MAPEPRQGAGQSQHALASCDLSVTHSEWKRAQVSLANPVQHLLQACQPDRGHLEGRDSQITPGTQEVPIALVDFKS